MTEDWLQNKKAVLTLAVSTATKRQFLRIFGARREYKLSLFYVRIHASQILASTFFSAEGPLPIASTRGWS